MKMDLEGGPIDWNKRPSEADLMVFEDGIPADDTRLIMAVDKIEREDVVPANPLVAQIANVRALIVKGGIPGLLIYNGIKASVVSTGAFMVCPGEDTEVKLIAAGAAGVSLLSASPTFWAACTLIAAKIGKRALNSISPRP